MSSELYYYRPTTPPSALTEEQLSGILHIRTASGSSVGSNNSSPESVLTNITTPNRSPVVRQHGPTLLPKIRPQDLVVEPMSAGGPHRHRKALSNTRNPPGYPYPINHRPVTQRTLADPVDCTLISPISTTSMLGSRSGSTLSSPVTFTPSHNRRPSGHQSHSRSGSASSIDEATLSRYGYPTYRQLPKYVSQYSPSTPLSASSLVFPTYHLASPIAPQATARKASPEFVFPEPATPTITTPHAAVVNITPSTTLLRYLTAPTQAINLVRSVSYPPNRSHQTYFWWDIRNLRSWSSFSLETINAIPGLTKLLTTEVPMDRTPPTNVPSSRLSPGSEAVLCDLIRDVYAPRVNSALQVSQGRDCLSLYPAPDAHQATSRNTGGPHFLANYATDTEQTSSGSPRGRVVGLVKSFDRWNSGMRNEQPHKRVEYLNGLAHLQKCMRDHSCRYGFIMTEIELVCVRAGCDEGDDVPYFGYLELAAPIATNTSSDTFNPMHLFATGGAPLSRSSSQSSDYSSSSRGASPAHHAPPPPELSGPFTATLALYYLLMLSKSVPLPSQPSWHLNVGGPGALTRQRVLPDGKDKWIPEPQTGERRDAKRMRGWVWPQDAWHRREGGGASRAKAAAAAATKKKWHK
ncbi:hypothetical protein AJ80_00942 [Polytolypa hystricis UAMH7299]|uniref:Sialidase n=1 Tax=Polytolypa hystricis (strain UAMH7299) TaxID=1447883 RepID=A0A2B7Z2L8_POLH7|nr:hypothetical protein AJ80_00942 [Polytolypa hystricis UAMH7299]